VGNDHQRPLNLCVSKNHDHSRQMVSPSNLPKSLNATVGASCQDDGEPEEVAVEEAAYGRFNGHLLAPERPHLPCRTAADHATRPGPRRSPAVP
jgi:hypothetical protein